MRKADSLWAKQEYTTAILEYERLYFTSANADTGTYALIRKAQCYKYKNDYEEAIYNLTRINNFGLSDSLSQNAYYETALCSYLKDDYSRCVLSAEQGLLKPLDEKDKSRFLLLKVLVNTIRYNYPEAKNALNEFASINKLKINVDSLYDKAPKYHKPGLAGVMSAIMPGSGQFYSKHYKEGIVNVGAQVILLAAGAVSLYYGYYIITGISWAGLWQGFYSGGAFKSEQYMRDYNNERANKFTRNIYSVLVNH